MDIKIGNVCLVANNSVESLIFWKKVQSKFPFLLCPCSINSTTRLVVIQDLDDAVLLQLEASPKNLTVFKKKDLKTVHR